MNKSLLIIVLAILQGACATPVAGRQATGKLLTFEQIADEIIVEYQSLEAATDLSLTTARNDIDSPSL